LLFVIFTSLNSNIMKYLFILVVSLITTNLANQAFAQQTVKVWGNCDMCKRTIEKAAVAAGAEGATWDKATKQLTIPGKADLKKIEQAIALVGYDTQNFTAKDEAYLSLPECCQYERKAVKSGSATAKADCCKDGKCEKGKDVKCEKGKCAEKKECCK
jgi:periplasmic mercuric ion binding protein